jgi:hypothetical protein
MLSEYQMTDRYEYLITSDDFLEQTTGEFLDSISHHFSEEWWRQYEQYHSQKVDGAYGIGENCGGHSNSQLQDKAKSASPWPHF